MIIIQQSIVPNKKRERPKKKRRPKKGQCYYPFSTLVLQSSTMIQRVSYVVLQSSTMFFIQRVSYVVTFIYQWKFYIIELGLYIPTMGFLKLPQVFMSKQVGCTPTQFILLSFHKLIALVYPLHGNPYSLTLISIDGHLHSPLIRLVDVRLSSPFCLLHNHHSIPHSAISMAHAHVLRED